MDWVPLLFMDDVCHHLNKPAFNQVSQLSGSWPSFGAEHREKRREFDFRCRVSNQEVSYSMRDISRYSRELTVADVNLEFDRITSFECGSASSNNPRVSRRVNRVSLREFERDILPTVASLVANCSLYLHALRSAQNQIFFNAFKNSSVFNEITAREQGEESRAFIAHQLEFGNVQNLTLYGTGGWPEEENLGETLKIFVSSTRFYQLNSPDLWRDESELFELFLERALANELKKGASISTPGTNLDKNRLLALHPECRHDSEEDAWRIPDSNLRIALRHDFVMLCVRVE